MLVLLNGLQAGNHSGTGVYTTELAYWLPRERRDLDIVTVWPRDLPRPHFDFPAHEAFLARAGKGAFGRILYDQLGILRDRKRLRANLIHYPASVGALFGTHETIVTVHDVTFLHNPAWFGRGHALYYRHGVARGVALAKRVIAVSQATADDVMEHMNVPKERIDVIPNGVNEAFRPVDDAGRSEVRERLGLPETFVLYVGTLEPRKNLPRLIRAWSSIAAEHPANLVMAGREGWHVGPIRRAAADSPHSERIHFLGYVAKDDLPALYSAADVFAYPSLCEGFGVPILEAMACGTPVLTSNVSSLPEVAGGAALLAEPDDHESIRDGLLRLLDDGALRDDLRKKGMSHAANFTWRRTAQQTLESYRKALSL